MATHAIGIDLGTTYSALAVINPAGKPEIVPNADGERTTASAVFFEEHGDEHVGAMAVDAAAAFPDRVARWVKREMGNPDWQFTVDGKDYSAVDISGSIISKVVNDARMTLGEIPKAVITVPAYFDEIRRKNTMDAAKKAGLEVLRIINEPTAAAVAYATTGKVTGKVMVYDFGGGTFDVTVVDIVSPREINVLASEGDHRLGGIDLDIALAEHLSGLFEKEHGINLLETDESNRQRVLAMAEQTKRVLSTMETKPGIMLNWGAHSLNVSVDRSTFNEITNKHIVQTEMLVENALSESGLTTAQIDAVILVGGSTRIPAVATMLKEKFGKPPLQTINPDEAVALGAAIQAGIILEQKGEGNLPEKTATVLRTTLLQDVSNHGYGTIYIGQAYGRDALRNDIIIPKNTPIPCSQTKSYFTIHDNQVEIDCTITQGEDEDPEFVNKIREAIMELPSGRDKGCEIKVTFSYDANERMQCEFKDIQSGRVKMIEMHLESDQTEDDEFQLEIDEDDLEGLVL